MMRIFLLAIALTLVNSLQLQTTGACQNEVAICNADDAASSYAITTLCGGDATCESSFTGAPLCAFIDYMVYVVVLDAAYVDPTFPSYLSPVTNINSTDTQMIIATQNDLIYTALWTFALTYQATGSPYLYRKYANVLQCNAEAEGLDYYGATNFFSAAGNCMADTACNAALARVTQCSRDAGVPIWEAGSMTMPADIDDVCEMFDCSAEEADFEVAGFGSLGFVNFWAQTPFDMQTCMDKIEEEIMAQVSKLVMLVAMIASTVGSMMMGSVWLCCVCRKRNKNKAANMESEA